MTQRAQIVEELPVWLEVNGERHATWAATPAELESLAIGRLLTDEFIACIDQLVRIEIVRDSPHGTIGLRAHVVDPGRGWQRRQHLAEHRCGVLGLVTCLGTIRPRSTPAAPLPPHDRVGSWQRALFSAEAELRAERGGMHAAAVVSGGELGLVAADVSRHSAVDKAIGAALRAGVDLRVAGLVISSRISGEIAAKACTAGMAWVASRSIPTSLAVTVAAAAGMPLIARAGSSESATHGT